MRDIVRHLVPAMKAWMTVDWATRDNVQAAVRAKVKRLLRKHLLKIPQLTPSLQAAAGRRCHSPDRR